MIKKNGNERIYAFDAIRAFAMILGVFFHIAMAYTTHATKWWSGADQRSSSIFYNFLTFSLHQFRMPVFFIIAGYFSVYLYNKIGIFKFIKHRVIRVVIPFLAAFILVRPFSIIVSNLNIFLSDYFTKKVWLDLHLGHLWFLYYLLFFYLILIALQKPLSKIKIKTELSSKFYQSKVSILVLALPLVLVFLPMKLWATPDATFSFTLTWSSFGYYFLFFFYGVFLQKANLSLKDYSRSITFDAVILVFSCVLSYLLLTNFERYYSHPYYKEIKILTIFLLSVFKIVAIYLVFSCSVKFFSKDSKVQRYLSDSAYWIYLIHLPLVVYAQIYLREYNLPSAVKFSLVAVFALSISYLSYHFLVRYTFVGFFLHGRKYK